jgi:outer membrane protein TolC
MEVWPGSKGTSIAAESGGLRQRSAQNTWYPRLSLGGQATWQSDVTEVSLPLPGMMLPEIPHDQYKLFMDVSQVLYDGGLSSSRAKMELLYAGADSVQVMVDGRKVKEMVIELYASVLYYRQLEELSLTLLERLNKRLDVLQSSADNGVLAGTDILLFRAEVKKAEQALNDAVMAETSMLISLSILTGTELNRQTPFEKPLAVISLSDEVKRPEFSLFMLQKDILNTSQSASSGALRPQFSAFAQGGYGRPALNMFSVDFDTYFLAGVRLNWNLYDWGQTAREKQVLELKKRTISLAEENLKQAIAVQLSQQQMEMERLKKQMISDDEIIALYEKVVEQSAVALEQGQITPLDYLDKESLWRSAGIEKARSEARYFRACSMYRFIKGEI